MRESLRRHVWVLLFCSIYYLALFTCYSLVIVPMYLGAGLVLRFLPPWLWLMSSVLVLLPTLWMPVAFQRPSDIASWLLYLCVIGPVSLFSFLISSVYPTDVIILPTSLTIAFGLFEFVRTRAPLSVKNIVNSEIVFEYGLPLAMVLVIVLVFSYSDFNFHISFHDVYDRREAAAEAAPAKSFVGYCMGWLRGVFVPLAVAVPILYRRGHYLWGLALLGALADFSFSGEKSDLLYPLVVLLTSLVLLRKPRRLHLWIISAFIGIVFIALAENMIFDSDNISTLFVRRQLVIPAQLTTYYWEFFSTNPLMLMSDGILQPFFGDRYALHTPALIGLEFFDWGFHANANIWAAGFAHFGYIGMGVVSMLGGALMWFVDSLALRRDSALATVICVTITMTWSNTALHTSLLTNGVVMLVVLFYLFPSWKRKKFRRRFENAVCVVHSAAEGGP